MWKSAILTTVAMVAFCSSARADVGKTWSTAGAKQFAAGKLDGVSVLYTGEVELGPEVEKIEGLEAEFVWDVEAGPDGTVYAAVGAPGGVYVVRDGKAEPLCKTTQKHVLCVLPLPDGAALAGTGPEGIVLRIGPDGETDTFADLEDAYIWDMALGPAGQVYCATGPKGRLVELNRDGEPTERLETKQKNMMCVAVDKEGTVYVGSEPDGYVYRVEPDGQAGIIYDTAESEVHGILLDEEGRIYACTAQGEPRGPRQGALADQSDSPAAGQAPQLSSKSVFGPPGDYNSIYRIVHGQGAELIARLEDVYILSIGLDGDRVLGGTGGDGRLMAVDPDGLVRIHAEFDAKYLTAIAREPDGNFVVGTTNAAGLWRVKKGCRQKGTFVSKPFDAGYLSRWGRIWWRERAASDQAVRIKMRTGNSSKPDQHWSAWTAWAEHHSGQVLDVPMGRFAQFSAQLVARDGSPTLLEVNLSYRQVNRRPRIEKLAVDGEPTSAGEDDEEEGPGGPRRRPPPAGGQGPGSRENSVKKRIVWQATDPNGDELTFDLYYRGLDEKEWKKLKKNMRDRTDYEWNTSRVPDGLYLLKLVARDDAVRPGKEALSDWKISNPMLVDNRRPAVAELSPVRQADGSYELQGVARDESGHIAKIEVSLNSGNWQPVFPSDGILDSPEEAFAYRTVSLKPGEHVFVFAATDANGNTGSGKLVVTVPPANE